MGTYPGGPKAVLQHERDTWGPGTRRGPGEDGSRGGPEAVGTRRGCDGAASRGGGTASWLCVPGDAQGTQGNTDGGGAVRYRRIQTPQRRGRSVRGGSEGDRDGPEGIGRGPGGPTCSRGQR